MCLEAKPQSHTWEDSGQFCPHQSGIFPMPAWFLSFDISTLECTQETRGRPSRLPALRILRFLGSQWKGLGTLRFGQPQQPAAALPAWRTALPAWVLHSARQATQRPSHFPLQRKNGQQHEDAATSSSAYGAKNLTAGSAKPSPESRRPWGSRGTYSHFECHFSLFLMSSMGFRSWKRKFAEWSAPQIDQLVNLSVN